jgi:hypothetical protein
MIHSPLPWKCEIVNGIVWFVEDAEGGSVITTDGDYYVRTTGDMEFLVKAVNAYESNQSLLRDFVKTLKAYHSTRCGRKVCDHCNLIARAEKTDE